MDKCLHCKKPVGLEFAWKVLCLHCRTRYVECDTCYQLGIDVTCCDRELPIVTDSAFDPVTGFSSWIDRAPLDLTPPALAKPAKPPLLLVADCPR